MVQTYIDTYQRPIQTVRQFDNYLTSLETQFLYIKNRMSHLFSKLKSKTRAIINNIPTVPQKRNEFVIAGYTFGKYFL